jgi:acetoin:2,6-dichlorophenolindophenol oxidoreductase subunit beta
LGRAKMLCEGGNLTIVSMSYMTVEALRAVNHLEKSGISCDLVDLRTISPLDWESIFKSVKKTGRLLVLDTGVATGSVAGEIVARVSMELFSDLKQAPQRLTLPDFPTPTSPALTESFYVRSEDIVQQVGKMLDKEISVESLTPQQAVLHDVPGTWFKGPF